MLHALDTSNGHELWGYIPPNVLKNLESIVSSKANSTNAIYGVDGIMTDRPNKLKEVLIERKLWPEKQSND